MTPPDPVAVLAHGKTRGVAVEDFCPVWTSARLRLSRAGWQAADLQPFLNLAVPYTATSSGRLSEDAVSVALAAHPASQGLRVLELGAGSGVFARLFLGALRRRAPDVYRHARYLVTDGSASVLAAQAASGVLDDHAGVIETRVLNLDGSWPDIGPFDMILCTYLLDSLAFDLLAIRDQTVWRREVRAVLPEAKRTEAEALRKALATDDHTLSGHACLGPLLALQTRHTAIDRATLPHAHTLPHDTGGETLPWVHSCGALACIDRALDHLSPGGVMIFSDYGHLTPYTRLDTPEFQSYGQSVAVGLNFPQIAAACAARANLRFHAPQEEDGHLFTRVLQLGEGPDLAGLVDDLYGGLRHRALTAPVDAAREMLRGRLHEAARDYYAKALSYQPQNWALLQEIALMLLLPNGEDAAARDMADIGLALNPLASDLWRAKAEALMGLGQPDAAAQAIERAAALAPQNVAAHQARAMIALRRGQPGLALSAIAEALTHDAEGDARDDLLALQSRTLARITDDARDRLQASVNALIPLDTPPDSTSPD